MKKYYILFILVFRIGIVCGQNFSVLNDSIGASSNNICTNDCINFYDSISNRTSWSWRFSGAIDSTSTDQNPQNIYYTTPGIFNVMLIAAYSGGRDTITFTNFINVNPSPPLPLITQSYDTLYCSTDSSYVSYQWYYNDSLIRGATDTFFDLY